MLEYLIANIGTIAVSLILAVIVSAIIVKSVKNKRQGKTSCSCGCSGCSMSHICHSKSERQKDDSYKSEDA